MKLKLTTMNAIVRIASKKQNKKRKLNAGQEREQIRIIMEAIGELPRERFEEVLDYINFSALRGIDNVETSK